MTAEIKTFPRIYTGYDQNRVKSAAASLGYDFKYRASTGTTMDDALVSERSTLWVADSQTEGRGRPGNRWYDTPKANVLVTVAVNRIELPNQAEHPLLLPQFAALAAVRAVRTVTKSDAAQVRWPYDLEIDGKKFGGVLVEKKVSTTGKPLTLIGVGMNVHDQVFKPFPWEAVALEQVPGIEPIDRNTLLIEFTKELTGLLDIIELVDREPDAYATWNRIWQEFESLGGKRIRAENVGKDGIGDLEGIARTPMLGKLLELVSTDTDGAQDEVTISKWDAFSLIRIL